MGQTYNATNVNKNNINNKRLSRLQGVILKILAKIHPRGASKRGLSRIVAGAYGKENIKLNPMAAMGIFMGTNPDPEIREFGDSLRAVKPETIEPKFSVSYCRSIRSLLEQGLVSYMPAYAYGQKDSWALFITEKGLVKIQNRKVKVNAKFWDEFLRARQQRGSCESNI